MTGQAPVEPPPGSARPPSPSSRSGKEHAAKVLAHMDPEEIETLGRAVLAVGAVPATEVRATLDTLAATHGPCPRSPPRTRRG